MQPLAAPVLHARYELIFADCSQSWSRHFEKFAELENLRFIDAVTRFFALSLDALETTIADRV